MVNIWFQRINILGESNRESAICAEEGLLRRGGWRKIPRRSVLDQSRVTPEAPLGRGWDQTCPV